MAAAAAERMGSPITADQAARVPARYADTIERVLFTEEQLQAKVKELAVQISADHAEEDSIMVVGLLKGAFLAVADVARNLTVPNKVDFMVASSYGGKATTSSGTVRLKKDLDIDPAGNIVQYIHVPGTVYSTLTRIGSRGDYRHKLYFCHSR